MFFTVPAADAGPALTEAEHVERLCDAFARIRGLRPFTLDAIVILPDHLHCVWRLPDGDRDYATRWRLIERCVSRETGRGAGGSRDDRRARAASSGWAGGCREHAIRDAADWRRHVDYVHFNPVRHGICANARDWRLSSMRTFVERGFYAPDWGACEPRSIRGMDLE